MDKSDTPPAAAPGLDLSPGLAQQPANGPYCPTSRKQCNSYRPQKTSEPKFHSPARRKISLRAQLERHSNAPVEREPGFRLPETLGVGREHVASGRKAAEAVVARISRRDRRRDSGVLIAQLHRSPIDRGPHRIGNHALNVAAVLGKAEVARTAAQAERTTGAGKGEPQS